MWVWVNNNAKTTILRAHPKHTIAATTAPKSMVCFSPPDFHCPKLW